MVHSALTFDVNRMYMAPWTRCDETRRGGGSHLKKHSNIFLREDGRAGTKLLSLKRSSLVFYAPFPSLCVRVCFLIHSKISLVEERGQNRERERESAGCEYLLRENESHFMTVIPFRFSQKQSWGGGRTENWLGLCSRAIIRLNSGRVTHLTNIIRKPTEWSPGEIVLSEAYTARDLTLDQHVDKLFVNKFILKLFLFCYLSEMCCTAMIDTDRSREIRRGQCSQL